MPAGPPPTTTHPVVSMSQRYAATGSCRTGIHYAILARPAGPLRTWFPQRTWFPLRTCFSLRNESRDARTDRRCWDPLSAGPFPHHQAGNLAKIRP